MQHATLEEKQRKLKRNATKEASHMRMQSCKAELEVDLLAWIQEKRNNGLTKLILPSLIWLKALDPSSRRVQSKKQLVQEILEKE